MNRIISTSEDEMKIPGSAHASKIKAHAVSGSARNEK